MKNYEKLSNAEIRIEIKNLENEYEATKLKIASLLKKMGELDDEYNVAKNELNKRGVKI